MLEYSHPDRQELSKLPEPAVPRAWSAGLYKAFGALVTISGGKNHGTMEKTHGKLYGKPDFTIKIWKVDLSMDQWRQW